jgi:lysophospholipase L1-like esterase
VRSGGDCSGFCDHALDFDAVLRDPAQVNRIRPDLDSGDGVHPNPAGYGLVAGSVRLADLGG